MSKPSNSTHGQMTIHLPGVIKTLGENLYSDPSVSIRELIQNANDTCVVRQAEDKAAPPSEIHIRVDTYRRMLVVEDNGAGMTEDEVKQFLTVIGASNTDQVRTRLEELGERGLAERLIGRFGLGLLSAFIIGDRIEFNTLSYKPGSQAIWWACDGGQEYEMGPAESRASVGTTVTVHVNPKHASMLHHEKLTELIHLYADLLEVPIYLDPKPSPVNAMTAPWHSEATAAEYRQFVTDRFPNDAVLDVIPIEISEDDGKFKVGGVLFVPKQSQFIVREHGDAIVYVRRMFVRKDERSLLPEWAKFVKGVIESPNLRETASREAIKHDENLERVRHAIGTVLLDYLAHTAAENARLFKEIVTNHNVVIKAWAVASDELFERIEDIVLFTTDAGLLPLPRYFEMSRYSKGIAQEEAKRYIFFFTTPGGAGQHTMLFAAKGLRVIDASQFPDASFLQKYARRHEDIILKRLDVGGDFVFEDLEHPDHKWADLVEEYSHLRIDAKVVKFVPEDIPAVLVFPDAESSGDQVEKLLADPNLSDPLRQLVKEMWDEREKHRRGRISSGGILYVNAASPIIQKLADLDLTDYEIQDVMVVIYNNAMMLSTQGARMYLTPDSARKVFEGNNRAVAALMTKIYEVRDLKSSRALEQSDQFSVSSSPLRPITQPVSTHEELTRHITCFVAISFDKTYDVVLEALRDVLEVAPYFWHVVRADNITLDRAIPENVGKWIARSHCFFVDLSEPSSNIMMELGYMYWGFRERKPIVLLREDKDFETIADLPPLVRISYPWAERPDQSRIAAAIRRHVSNDEQLKNLKGQEHYLSSRLLHSLPYARELAESLTQRFRTVEELLDASPAALSRELGSHLAPVGVLEAVQDSLREVCRIGDHTHDQLAHNDVDDSTPTAPPRNGRGRRQDR